jgi:hypothetical protein
MLTMEDIDLNSHHLLLLFYHRCPVEELHEVVSLQGGAQEAEACKPVIRPLQYLR